MDSAHLPDLFLERLRSIIPEEHLLSVSASFSAEKPLSVRINKLKDAEGSVLGHWTGLGISYRKISWCPDAFIIEPMTSRELDKDNLIQEGRIYCQGLASMLPVTVLNPEPGERVLDMCAAPGSKTTQIAAMMQNQGRIECLEPVRERYYKLKKILHQYGVTMTRLYCLDARRFRSEHPFDKILADVPCSSEGRFRVMDRKSYAYWSPRKIKEMTHKQRGILLNACRLLKTGGTLVYSTCTFAPEENEGVIDWVLRKTDGTMKVEPIGIPGVDTYPSLTRWQKKVFDPQVSHCLRVLPGREMEGFFMARLIKVKD